VPDPIAIWGAVTGTAGVIIAVRREVVSNRRRLVVLPGVNLTISRTEPPEVRLAWAAVQVYNGGGRPLAVEHVGFRYFARYVGELPEGVEQEPDRPIIIEHRAQIYLREPITLAVDGPSRTIYTPLGPMLAAGISAVAPLEAFAITTGGGEWFSPPTPIIQATPPGMTLEQLADDLNVLREGAESPPEVEGLVWLAREDPHLLDE
jgi:hypothetical protein